MLIENQHPLNKSITMAVLGRPNAGKSSLINHLLGFDLSIVSERAQTTRNQFHCVVLIDRTEMIFVDTPGVHQVNQEINKRMNQEAVMGSEGADLNLLLCDARDDYMKDLDLFFKGFDGELKSSWLLLTKSDLVSVEKFDLNKILKQVKVNFPFVEKVFLLSSKNGDNIHLLLTEIEKIAPNSPHLYPNGDVSNKNQRFFVSEYIREQAFRELKEELPYELAVVIEEFKDKGAVESGVMANISASILVNRPSQRAIVIGRQGSLIKKIGSEARKKIEAMMGGKVFLNLHVKVSPKWFKNNYVLDEIGLPRPQQGTRVWRKTL